MAVEEDDRVDALYAGPPEDFVAARDALAKALRVEGDKAAAAEVKALRRPTVAAWAVNQVARTTKTKKDVAALLQVGDRLRDAHEALLDGKGDAGIREATVERRKLVAKLTKAAVEVLGAGGDAQREAITNTFDAAVADPGAGLLVRSGRLQKELEAPSGFGGDLVFAVPAAPAGRARRDERRAARRARKGDTAAPAARPAETVTETGTETETGTGTGTERPAPSAADRAAARAAAKEAERRRKQLQTEADDRQHEAQQAAREAAAARQEVSRLQDLLVTANAKAKAADERARMAQWQASTAQQALRDAEEATTNSE